jgi:predicted transcriptional regulator
MKISEEKRKKISEQILFFLFIESPKPIFTSHIAKEIARDEEFVKKIMEDLCKSNFVIKVNKNKLGKEYKLRNRWILSESTYKFYKNNQH